jgi:hypothetical protein
MGIIEAEKCMGAFKKICDQADENPLTSSEECHFWVFEQGYKAAMKDVAILKRHEVPAAVDSVTKSLMHGFNLLERFKANKLQN